LIAGQNNAARPSGVECGIPPAEFKSRLLRDEALVPQPKPKIIQ
jgi:hypothetical protein